MHQPPELPTSFSEALPAPFPAPFANTLFLAFSLGFIALTVQAVRTLPHISAPLPAPAFQSTPLPMEKSPPRLLLALSQPAAPTPANNFQLTQAQKDLAPLAAHVTQELLADQLSSVALKMSLAQQVGQALFNATR